jgi:surface antigen
MTHTSTLPHPADVLDAARADLGYHEHPQGSNCQKYSKHWGHPCEPWCADAACRWLEKGGALDVPMSAYTPTLAEHYKSRDRFGQHPRVGALMFFDFIGRISHVGIVEAILSDGRVVTLEGNTDEAGGRTGGKVMRHIRDPKASYFVGYGYPKYAEIIDHPTLRRRDTGKPVRQLQRRLVDAGFHIAIDGDFGERTETAVNAVKRRNHLKPNGVAGYYTWHALERRNAA